MTKKWTLAAVFLLILAFSMPFFHSGRALAAEVRVTDDINYLSDAEEQKLESLASQISSRYDVDIFVMLVDQQGFSDNEARDVIESYGPTRYPNGYLGFIVNMSDRSYWVDAYGTDVRAIFVQDLTDRLSEIAYGELRDGNYYGACKGVLEEADRILAVKTDPMGWLKKPFIYWQDSLFVLGGSGIIAIVTAGLWTGIRAGKHKDKALAADAAVYGSNFVLSRNSDRFMRQYQTRVPRPKQNSSGGGFSGGGGSSGHTGSGGHF